MAQRPRSRAASASSRATSPRASTTRRGSRGDTTDEPTRIAIIESSGNVFADLGLPDADAELAKALLVRVLRQAVADRFPTQAAAARQLGIAASDMSDLVRGRIARFSQERIETLLTRAGFDIEIRVTPAATPGATGTLRVVTSESAG